jgi:hypothetical protein
MRKIKAILIDPFACTVTHVELDGDNHKSYYPHLSHPSMSVDCFTSVPLDVLTGSDTLFVDDEGQLKDAQRWFTIHTGHQPYAGKGLIVGADWDGDAVDVPTLMNSASRAASCSLRLDVGDTLYRDPHALGAVR